MSSRSVQNLTSYHFFHYYLQSGLPAFLFFISIFYSQCSSQSESWQNISQIMAEDSAVAPHFSPRNAKALTMAYNLGSPEPPAFLSYRSPCTPLKHTERLVTALPCSGLRAWNWLFPLTEAFFLHMARWPLRSFMQFYIQGDTKLR